MLRHIQGLLQWCFFKVEGLFNLAFGDKLNPLYYIGAISYYLMWLIVAIRLPDPLVMSRSADSPALNVRRQRMSVSIGQASSRRIRRNSPIFAWKTGLDR